MSFRHQLAVYSPIPLPVLREGIAGMLGLRGKAVEQVAARLGREFRADSLVLCDSGTHALQVAIQSASGTGTRRGLVALPAFCCFDVATAAIGAGSDVTLYDVDEQTLAPRIDSLRRALQRGAGIVVIAPLYGVPVPWEALEALAAQFGVALIEDAAQGHGASWSGRPLGSLGRLSVLSFGRGKGWTGGGGGAVLLRNQVASTLVLPDQSLPRQGKGIVSTAAQYVLGRPSVYGLPRNIPALHLGDTTFVPPSAPMRMAEGTAAALLASAEESRAEGERRKWNAQVLLSGITANERLAKITPPPDSIPGYLRLPLRLRGGLAAFGSGARALTLGISPSYPISLAELEPLRPHLVAAEGEEYPGARLLARDLITLPTHSLVSERERGEIIDIVTEGSLP